MLAVHVGWQQTGSRQRQKVLKGMELATKRYNGFDAKGKILILIKSLVI